MKQKYFVHMAVIGLLYLILATPAFAHEDPGISSGATLAPLIGGLIGGVVLAGVAMMMIQPKPDRLMLSVLFGIGFAGILHLAVALIWGDNLLLLNGAGFIVLGIAWGWFTGLVPGGRTTILAVLAVYTLVTFVGYFVTHDHFDLVGLASKAAEAFLLIVIGIILFRPSSAS